MQMTISIKNVNIKCQELEPKILTKKQPVPYVKKKLDFTYHYNPIKITGSK